MFLYGLITTDEPFLLKCWIIYSLNSRLSCFCFFLFGQAFVDEAKELGLGWWMRNVDEYRKIVRLAGTLPLLPRRLMHRGLVLLTRNAMSEGRAFYRRVRPFLRYLNRRWVSHRIRSRWMNVYNSRHRTNNAAESLNKLLKLLMGNHPNIYKFIGLLFLFPEMFSKKYFLPQ